MGPSYYSVGRDNFQPSDAQGFNRPREPVLATCFLYGCIEGAINVVAK
jgi:hypothetical protein